MTFFSVDPSYQRRHTGVCVWRGGRPEEFVTLAAGGDELMELSREATRLVAFHSPEAIVLEGQFHRQVSWRKGKPMIPFQSIGKLTEAATVWKLLGVDVVSVPPETWLRHMGLYGQKGEMLKRLLAACIETRLRDYKGGTAPRNEHERSAFLIGCWYVETEPKTRTSPRVEPESP